MAETVDGDHKAAFWLPTHFLTDDDFMDHNPRSPSKDSKNFDLFSGGFDPFFGPSSVTSSETGPEPERDQHGDDFLAELTRHLAGSTLLDKSHPTHNASEISLRFSSSPQSTLSGFGGWSNRSGLSSNGSPNAPSQVHSPPVTPPTAKNDAAWELLYEAAREVSRLKMNAVVEAQRTHNLQNRGLVEGPRNPPMSFPRTNQTVKRQDSSIWGNEREESYCHHRRGCGGVGALGLPQSAWPPLGGSAEQLRHRQHHQQQGGAPPVTRPVFLGVSGFGSGSGAGMKKSTGTGVFLPRRPGFEPPADSRRNSSAGMPVLLPARVVQALNLDLEGMNGDINLNSQSRFGCGGGFITDQELLLARKNSVMGHQRNLRRDLAATMAVQGHEVCLPSDWTY